MINNKYPNLHNYLGAYFHEDFLHEFGSVNNAIKAFKRDNNEDYIAVVRSDLREFLASFPNEIDQNLLMTLGCYYLPEQDGEKTKSWLNEMLLKL